MNESCCSLLVYCLSSVPVEILLSTGIRASMAPTTRNQHSSKPSSPPATSAPVPPLSSQQSFPLLPSPSSSSQTGNKSQLQIEEIQGSVSTLQNEVFQSISTLHQNQASFQNQITSQISALQNTLMQTLTLLQSPNNPPPNPPPPNNNLPRTVDSYTTKYSTTK